MPKRGGLQVVTELMRRTPKPRIMVDRKAGMLPLRRLLHQSL
jgi:hypothetical protein